MLPFKPILLWTDMLVLLLIAAVIAFVVRARQHEHLRAPWRKVARSTGGMIAAPVLLAFLAIGFLDSLHFQRGTPPEKGQAEMRYGPDVLSVLDVLVEHLRVQQERSFSAPFATHAHSRETITRPDGSQVREFPRLRHGGSHLANPETDRAADIGQRLLRALGISTVLGVLASVMVVGTYARRRGLSFDGALAAMREGNVDIPIGPMLVSALLLITTFTMLFALSGVYHVFGTDKVGQDVFYLTLKSIRTALVIGTATTLVMLPFAVTLGMLAGYFRGRIDDAIQYLYTTLSSIPDVLLIAAAVLMMQVYMDTHPEIFDSVTRRADFRLTFLCIILGVTSWTGLCRLLRGETLKLREQEYVLAAQAFGVSHFRILLRHILPNVFHLVIITTVLKFSGLVLAEAVLSYVGVGVDPAMNSFGTMINAARLEMAREPIVWWSLAAAFAFMLLLVLSANLFADAVRDAFDPRMRAVRRGSRAKQAKVPPQPRVAGAA